MKFKEASLETHGCEASLGAFLYPKSAKLSGKIRCPLNKMRCCFFCDEIDCSAKCDIVKLLPRQPMSIQLEFDCPRLVTMETLAWKYLLGPNVPKL